MTKGERAVSLLRGCNLRLTELQRSSYSDDDVRQVVNQAVVAIELFIKDALYSRKRDKEKFEKLIDDLPASHGLPAAVAAPLNEARRLYNKAHHSVELPFSLGEAISKMSASADAIEFIVAQGAGECGLDARPAFRRVFWVAGWFHPNGGDVETDIIVPDQGINFTWSSYDSIYLRLDAWNTLEADLARIGRVRKASAAISATVMARFEEVGDLVGCFEYEGDYRALVKYLSEREDRQDLMPFLLRENNARAMCRAACFAAVDVANSSVYTSDVEAIVAAIASRAEVAYAAPTASKPLAVFSKRLASLLSRNAEWATLTGPIAIDASDLDALVSDGKAVPDSPNDPEPSLFAISVDNILLVAD